MSSNVMPQQQFDVEDMYGPGLYPLLLRTRHLDVTDVWSQIPHSIQEAAFEATTADVEAEFGKQYYEFSRGLSLSAEWKNKNNTKTTGASPLLHPKQLSTSAVVLLQAMAPRYYSDRLKEAVSKLLNTSIAVGSTIVRLSSVIRAQNEKHAANPVDPPDANNPEVMGLYDMQGGPGKWSYTYMQPRGPDGRYLFFTRQKPTECDAKKWITLNGTVHNSVALAHFLFIRIHIAYRRLLRMCGVFRRAKELGLPLQRERLIGGTAGSGVTASSPSVALASGGGGSGTVSNISTRGGGGSVATTTPAAPVMDPGLPTMKTFSYEDTEGGRQLHELGFSLRSFLRSHEVFHRFTAHASAFYHIGCRYYAKDRVVEATAFFTRGLALVPSENLSQRALLCLARSACHLRLGNYALAQLDAATALDNTSNTLGFLRRGVAGAIRGDVVAARADIYTASESSVNYAEVGPTIEAISTILLDDAPSHCVPAQGLAESIIRRMVTMHVPETDLLRTSSHQLLFDEHVVKRKLAPNPQEIAVAIDDLKVLFDSPATTKLLRFLARGSQRLVDDLAVHAAAVLEAKKNNQVELSKYLQQQRGIREVSGLAAGSAMNIWELLAAAVGIRRGNTSAPQTHGPAAPIVPGRKLSPAEAIAVMTSSARGRRGVVVPASRGEGWEILTNMVSSPLHVLSSLERVEIRVERVPLPSNGWEGSMWRNKTINLLAARYSERREKENQQQHQTSSSSGATANSDVGSAATSTVVVDGVDASSLRRRAQRLAQIDRELSALLKDPNTSDGAFILKVLFPMFRRCGGITMGIGPGDSRYLQQRRDEPPYTAMSSTRRSQLKVEEALRWHVGMYPQQVPGDAFYVPS